MNRAVILLVEDNADDVRQTLRSFARNSIANEVVVAGDGAQALDYLFGTGAFSGRDVSDLPGLVLLDLKLPRVSGLDVLRRIRADPRTEHLPVVVLTSSRQEQDLMQSYELGANVFVRKPIHFAEFLNAARFLGLYWTLVGSGLALLHREGAPDLRDPEGPPGPRVEALRPPESPPDVRALQIVLGTADAHTAHVLREVFSAEGHTLAEARDASGTFRLLLVGLPDVLVVDRQLPDLSGVEVVRSLRRSPAGRAVHVILLAADVARARAEVGDDAVEVFGKPTDVLRLLDHLRALRVAGLVNALGGGPDAIEPMAFLPPPHAPPLPELGDADVEAYGDRPPESPRQALTAWDLLGIAVGAPDDVVERAVDALLRQLTLRARLADTPAAREHAAAMATRVRNARSALVDLCRSRPRSGGSS